MKRRLYLLYIFFMYPLIPYAIHLEAGDMTAQHVAGFTWRFTLSVYTKIESVQDHPDLDLALAKISVNGREVGKMPRTELQVLAEYDTYRNVFVFNYTFGGNGRYTVSFTEVNRNSQILNINGGNSEVPFYVETTIFVSSLTARNNNSPVLLVMPLDKAAVNEVFTHNPGAYDQDGDSLVYKLVVPKTQSNTEVPAYNYPQGISLDPFTGTLVWDRPKEKGLYNVAFVIEEWRNGARIGSVMRDMQIEVKETDNNPPIVIVPADTCVLAGVKVDFPVSATDPDGHKINLSAFGGPLSIPNSPATFTLGNPNPQDTPATGNIQWQTNCTHVRNSSFQMVFKAEDLPPGDIRLSDLKALNVKVLAPPVEVVATEAYSDAIKISWKPYNCQNAEIIEIWRKDCDALLLKPSLCDTRFAVNSGFKKIGEVSALALEYTDNDNGKGLKQTNLYCYLLRTRFRDPMGGLGAWSESVCATPGVSAPVPLQVTVLKTDSSKGSIALKWEKPIDFDSSIYTPPYQFTVFRAVGMSPGSMQPVYTATGLENLSFEDQNLNTYLPYTYRIDFTAANRKAEGSNTSSTVFLNINPGSGKAFLKWQYQVPWNNSENEHKVLRRKFRDQKYEQVAAVFPGAVDTISYIDDDLNKKDTLCYVVETTGNYCNSLLPQKIINRSQELCIIPVDSSSPCPPFLFLKKPECLPVDLTYNTVYWQPDMILPCNPDIAAYKIYFSERMFEETSLLTSVSDTFYYHKDTISLAGCYEVTALNIYGVESRKSNRICIDICTDYNLPNLITPNGDQLNDFFCPLADPLNVASVDFLVYNRWGDQIYSYTGDPMIYWKGVDNAGNPLSDGIYFYSAKVRFKRRLRETDEIMEHKGWVQIIKK